MGYQFNRQKPLDNFIVDFYCKELKLVIEIDGASHDGERAVLSDDDRQRKLEELNLKFLRFPDIDVKRDMDNVIRNIETYIIDLEAKMKLNPPVPF